MVTIGKRTKVIGIISGIALMVVGGLVTQSLIMGPKANASAGAPTYAGSRYQIITANTLEAPSLPYNAQTNTTEMAPRANYDRVLMVDTATGATWELNKKYGWFSLGIAPQTRVRARFPKPGEQSPPGEAPAVQPVP